MRVVYSKVQRIMLATRAIIELIIIYEKLSGY